jgi:thiamine biosynthesis lipoprotein
MQIVQHHDGYQLATFKAMASPCEVLIESDDALLSQKLAETVRDEARRIEYKFSRYRDDSVVQQINQSNGAPVAIDSETALLLTYADQCYQLSEGRFDITSGILRNVWKFDGGNRIPDEESVRALLPHIGWERIRREELQITLPIGMEIDLGGFGKEYAVDRAVKMVRDQTSIPVVVNFGGDLVVTGPRQDGSAWDVAVEAARDPGRPAQQIAVRHGALATSGDSQRYLLNEGKRYSHVLDPKTGWPVADAPIGVTVLASNCSEAGFLATLALLHGRDAESFLDAQDARYWCERADTHA